LIETVKELEKLIKMCRKQGVVKIAFDNVNIELGDLPSDPINTVDAGNDYSDFPAGTLSDEQLMFYSSGGLPKDDPALKEANQ
jgi:hypothetical protein